MWRHSVFLSVPQSGLTPEHRLGVTAHTLNPTLRKRLHSSTTHSVLCNNNYIVTVTRIFTALHKSKALNQSAKSKVLTIKLHLRHRAFVSYHNIAQHAEVCSTSLNWGTGLGHTSFSTASQWFTCDLCYLCPWLFHDFRHDKDCKATAADFKIFKICTTLRVWLKCSTEIGHSC